MSDLVLGEIINNRDSLLISLPKLTDTASNLKEIWAMLDSLCVRGELVKLTLSSDAAGTKCSNFRWPISKEELRKALDPEYNYVNYKANQTVSADTKVVSGVVGKFFVSKVKHEKYPLLPLVVVKREANHLALKFSMGKQSLIMGWKG